MTIFFLFFFLGVPLKTVELNFTHMYQSLVPKYGLSSKSPATFVVVVVGLLESGRILVHISQGILEVLKKKIFFFGVP